VVDLICLCAWLAAFAPALGTAPPTCPAPGVAAVTAVPVVRAVRLSTLLILDGRLDEPAWRDAPPARNFRQSDPNEGQPASERTEMRVLYDDDALYVGARMFDSEPGKIVRRLSRRDDAGVDADWLTVYLDPHHDHLTGARFQVTAAGSLADAAIYNDTFEDASWDAVWDAKVALDGQGWTGEFRIPFSQLRFVASEHQTWGLNVERFIRRGNECDWWELVLKKESGKASRMGHLEGIDGIPVRRHLDLLPYTTARAEHVGTRTGDPFNGGSRYFGNAGVDLKWGLTNNLTLDATLNPDFGHVEVDPAVVNLTAFETFYEEKRPFFNEGSNIFSNFGRSGSNTYASFSRVDPTLFYSRRIGRPPQGGAGGDFVDSPRSTTILGAAKLTGKTASGWSVGLIEAVTGRESAQVDTGGVRSSALVEPATSYLIGRVKREVASRASVGLMFTGVERALGGSSSLHDLLDARAYTAGSDAHLFLDSKRDWVVNGLFAGSFVQGSRPAILRLQRGSTRYFQRPDAPHVRLDPTRTSLSGWDGQLNVNKNTGTLFFNASLWGVSPGFEVNDTGFSTFADRAGTHAVIVWSKPNPDRWTLNRAVTIAKWYAWNFNREIQKDGIYVNGLFLLPNYWQLHGTSAFLRSSLDDRLTRGGPSVRSPSEWEIQAGIESDSRKQVGFELNAHRDGRLGGFQSTLQAVVAIRPSPSLTVSIGPTILRSYSAAQYVRTVDDVSAARTFGARYVFADLDQTEVSMTTRLNFIFTPRASLQVYMQPLLSTGRFWGFKELAQARTFDFLRYGSGAGTLAYDAAWRTYTVAPEGGPSARSFAFQDPVFNVESLRANVVFRWEWRLGSSLYAVWTQQREDHSNPGTFGLRRDLSSLLGAHGDNVFAVKVACWLTR